MKNNKFTEFKLSDVTLRNFFSLFELNNFSQIYEDPIYIISYLDLLTEELFEQCIYASKDNIGLKPGQSIEINYELYINANTKPYYCKVDYKDASLYEEDFMMISSILEDAIDFHYYNLQGVKVFYRIIDIPSDNSIKSIILPESAINIKSAFEDFIFNMLYISKSLL